MILRSTSVAENSVHVNAMLKSRCEAGEGCLLVDRLCSGSSSSRGKAKYKFYHPQMNLGGGNVFIRVCHSVHGGGTAFPQCHGPGRHSLLCSLLPPT